MQTRTEFSHSRNNRQYRRMVLSGQLSGDDLLVPFIRQVKEINSQDPPTTLYALNSSFLWHLAHCPRQQDRKSLQAIAECFQYKLKLMSPALWSDYEGPSKTPIPFSPIRYPIREVRDLWFEEVFPRATIDWKDTFDSFLPGDRTWITKWLTINGIKPIFHEGQIDTADFTQQIARKKQKHYIPNLSDLSFIVSLFEENNLFSPGMHIVALAETPTYQAMQSPAETQQKEGDIFPYLQQALAMRGLEIADFAAGREDINNLSLPMLQLGVINCRPGSRAYTFELDRVTLLMLFTRNRWSIGYGIAQELSDDGFITLRLHIFREYRETSCSSEFLIAQEQIAGKRWTTRGFQIDLELGSSCNGLNYLGEDIKGLIRFYNRNGYWFDRDQGAMAKYL